MTEVERILDQLKRAFSGEAWHGPAVVELLAEVSSQQAAEHPINGAHSIWELVLHIGAWEGAVRSRLGGERAELAESENWPAVTQTDELAWERAKALLESVHEDLYTTVAKLDDSRLDLPIVPGMSSVYVTLHGIIQHTLYHAGQIAVLRKAFREDERK